MGASEEMLDVRLRDSNVRVISCRFHHGEIAGTELANYSVDIIMSV